MYIHIVVITNECSLGMQFLSMKSDSIKSGSDHQKFTYVYLLIQTFNIEIRSLKNTQNIYSYLINKEHQKLYSFQSKKYQAGMIF